MPLHFTCDDIQNVCQLGQAQCLGFTIIMSHWAKCTTLLSIEYMSKITLFRAKFSTKITPLPRRKNKIPPWGSVCYGNCLPLALLVFASRLPPPSHPPYQTANRFEA